MISRTQSMRKNKHHCNSETKETPLITYAIFAFNQEAYIREAIDAAFSQTYSPLEIIISDDASADATPEIIRRMVAEYQGPHKVIVNINEKNLGIGAHVNKVFQMASGDFLILAAGDDVSAPDRTQLTVARWVEKGRLPSMVYCEADVIDADGKYAGRLDTALPDIDHAPSSLIGYSHPKRLLLMGACAAYAKRVISDFGPLMEELGVEDIPLAIRSSQMGGIECIGQPLVQYRRNVSVWLPRKLPNENFERHFSRMSHRVRANHKVAAQISLDLEKSKDEAAILAAKKRYMCAKFSLYSLEERRFHFMEYLKISIKTNYWRENLLPAIFFGFPRIHKIAFRFSQFIRREP